MGMARIANTNLTLDIRCDYNVIVETGVEPVLDAVISIDSVAYIPNYVLSTIYAQAGKKTSNF